MASGPERMVRGVMRLVEADPLAHRALDGLLRAEAAVRRRLSADLEREGISAPGFTVLVLLREAGGGEAGEAAADHAHVGVEVAVQARAAGALRGRDPEGGMERAHARKLGRTGGRGWAQFAPGPTSVRTLRVTTVYMHTLGCPKNRVDSEIMLGELAGAGFRLVRAPRDADVIVVNSLGGRTAKGVGPAYPGSIACSQFQ